MSEVINHSLPMTPSGEVVWRTFRDGELYCAYNPDMPRLQKETVRSLIDTALYGELSLENEIGSGKEGTVFAEGCFALKVMDISHKVSTSRHPFKLACQTAAANLTVSEALGEGVEVDGFIFKGAGVIACASKKRRLVQVMPLIEGQTVLEAFKQGQPVPSITNLFSVLHAALDGLPIDSAGISTDCRAENVIINDYEAIKIDSTPDRGFGRLAA